MNIKMRERVKTSKRQVRTLYLCYRHKGTKWYQKAFVVLVIAYAVSPVDLIPDLIPVIGLLDDLLLIPLGIYIAIKLIPKDIWEECAQKADYSVAIGKKYSVIGVMIIVFIWAAAIAAVVFIVCIK
jgi:uncharacterized membrane protein YkvA (DUF1232 family)